MTEPQVWTVIVGFFAMYLGTFTLFASLQRHTMNVFGDKIDIQIGALGGVIERLDKSTGSKIDGLRNEMVNGLASVRSEMTGGFDRVHDEFGSVRHEVASEIGSVRSEVDGLRAEMNARFDTVDTRLATIDRDVQALTERVFRTDGT